MTNPMKDSDELQEILDELATNIHNLSPGDVGSMDRVLLHIRKAKERIEAHYQPQAAVSNKETHNIRISAMAPSYCIDCNLSGSDLDREPCVVTERQHPNE